MYFKREQFFFSLLKKQKNRSRPSELIH